MVWKQNSCPCNNTLKHSKDNSTTFSFSQTPHNNSKYSLFVSVQHKGNEFYIRKSTAVWLFSEGERVSTDRLLQPFCEKTNKSPTEQSSPSDTINVGDICVFILSEDKFNIGRVLQFAYHKESLKKAREYKGKTVNLTASNIADIGILCSWYTQESNSDRTFILNTEKDEVVVHQYQPVTSY